MITASPRAEGIVFTPTLRQINLSGNVSGIDFEVQANSGGSGTGRISGLVVNDLGQPLSGVTVSTGGIGVTTHANGFYLLSGLADGSHVVAPSQSGMIFTPTSWTSSTPPDHSGVNFIGSVGTTYDVSGQVVDVSNAPIEGVVISAGTGQSTTTDTTGQYTLVGLPGGSYHSIIPEMATQTI